MIRAFVAAGFVAALLALLTQPAAQADSGVRPGPVAGVAAYTLEESRCYAKPNLDSGPGAIRLVISEVYEVSERGWAGSSIGGGAATWKYISTPGDRAAGCFTDEEYLSSLFPSALAEVDWTGEGVIGAPSGAGMAGILSSGGGAVRSGPSSASLTMADLEDGTVVETPADVWSVTGDMTFAGPTTWTLVRVGGVAGFMQARSVIPIPTVDLASLTSEVTPLGPVQVYDAPTVLGTQLDTAEEGIMLPAGVTPTLGFLPVSFNGTVAWISQKDLLNASIATPETEPTAAASPTGPTLSERAQELYDEKFGAREEAAATDDGSSTGVIERMRDAFNRTPVAEVGARAALWTSGLLAGLAIVLAGIAHVGANARRSALDLAAPGIGVAAKWLPLPAAVLVGLIASASAPVGFFRTQVVVGLLGVAIAVGGALAHRVAAQRGARLTVDAARANGSTLALLAVGVGAVGVFLGGLDWPVAGFVGALIAAAYLGTRPEPAGLATTTEPAAPTLTTPANSLEEL